MDELQSWLREVRAERRFDPARYIEAKCTLLSAYARESRIRTFVVGVSGGVDSGVTLGLATRARSSPHSTIDTVIAALLPVFRTDGATHQSSTVERGREVAATFGARCVVIDLSGGFSAIRSDVDSALGVESDAWARGQLVSYLRTPALYYVASLLAKEGRPAIVLGTTNRDEGSYIGFFGKASDDMVDVQPISDLHKSEVYAVAHHLGVPRSVIEAAPSGDTFDGRTDVEMIGAPYDFVELYTSILCGRTKACDPERVSSLSPEGRRTFEAFARNVEALHDKNLHKYVGHSPAVHLDVYPRAVPGGWPDGFSAACDAHPAIDPSRFPGTFELSTTARTVIQRHRADAGDRAICAWAAGDHLRHITGVLTEDECDALIAELEGAKAVPVGIHGMSSDLSEPGAVVGSHRASIFDPELARRLFERIGRHVPSPRVIDEYGFIDAEPGSVWRAIGLNPLFRFIRYERSGLLVPHYDSSYIETDGRRRTLMSVVLFLTTTRPGEDGQTRFVLDLERHLPCRDRRFQDHDAPSSDERRVRELAPRRGTALVFDHRLLHEARTFDGDRPRIVLRTDVLFETSSPVIERLRAFRWTRPDPEAEPDPAQDPFIRKAQDDRFYGGAYHALGTRDALVEAGFFDDGGDRRAKDDLRFDARFMCTPLDKIQIGHGAEQSFSRESATAGALDEIQVAHGAEQAFSRESGAPAPAPLVVLLSTGGFCPVHPGHLEMMVRSRAALEARGYQVLGGYLSPSHDRYIAEKCGDDAMTAVRRVELIAERLRESDWLMVDPWESLHVNRPINFTDVVDRLECYLSYHLRTLEPVRVAYVYGGDNARFGLTFADQGLGVCVPRTGYEEAFARYRAHPSIARNPRVIMDDGPPIRAHASRMLRAKNPPSPHEPGREPIREPAPRFDLIVRDEGAWAVAEWVLGRDRDALFLAWQRFTAELMRALDIDAFGGGAGGPTTGDRSAGIRIDRLESQLERAAELVRGRRVLSIDPCFTGDANLAVSRCFSLCSGIQEPRLVERPGCPPIATQLLEIPKGDYALLDDDTSTGRTLRAVRESLPAGVRVTDTILLCSALRHPSAGLEEARRDIIDARDFLAGSRDAGLVVRLPSGELGRTPYVAPYVDLRVRASVPLERAAMFSRSVWEINLRFFEAVTPAIRVRDTHVGCRRFLAWLGFGDATHMSDVCAWHLERSDRRPLDPSATAV